MTLDSENSQQDMADGFASVESDADQTQAASDEQSSEENSSEESAQGNEDVNAEQGKEAGNSEASDGEAAEQGDEDAAESAAEELAEIQKEMEDLNNQPVSKKVFDETVRRLNGRFGEVIGRLNQLQQRKPKINAEKLTATTANFDADYAKAHAEELNQAIEFEEGSQDEPQMSEAEKLAATQQLMAAHPDYAIIAKSPQYALWKASLPADVVETLENTWDAKYLSDALTEYKSYISAKQAAANKAEAERIAKEQAREQKQQQKHQRLQSSLQIKGSHQPSQGAGLTEADGFASVDND